MAHFDLRMCYTALRPVMVRIIEPDTARGVMGEYERSGVRFNTEANTLHELTTAQREAYEQDCPLDYVERLER